MSCPECGAPVADREACQALFEDLLAREFGRPELFGVHHLTVHAYTLQHPIRYMESAKSAAAHLTGLGWAVEEGGGPELNRVLSAWLERAPGIRRLEPPPAGERGGLTVAHPHPHHEAVAYRHAVWEWAEAVWAGWSRHHEQARAWVRAARSAPARSGRARGGA